MMLSFLCSPIAPCSVSHAQEAAAEQAAAPHETPASAPVDPQTVVARVNGVSVREADILEMLNIAISKTPQIAFLITNDEELKSFKREVLDQLVARELLSQESAKLEIPGMAKLVDEKYASVKASFPDEATFKAAISERNFTEELLKKDIEKTIRIQRLLDEKLKKGVQIPEEEIKSFYDGNKDKFTEPESMRARHILVRIEDGQDGEKKATEKIEGLLKRAKAGEDFAALAKDNSDDVISGPNGGDLGSFTRGRMAESFEKAVFALKSGEISGIVKTTFGLHIIKCEEYKPEKVVSFDEAKAEIKDYLENTAVEGKIEGYINSLRTAAKVEILLK
ncbi:MAG: peptidylprolyl isomerase [Nitrospirae bacterium]|nr:peptidylprolyl isomerase [Nitrospirota bacterium]